MVAFVRDETGIDGDNKIKGRKRHILVDTLGLPLAINVSAANTADFLGGFELLVQLEKGPPCLKLIRADQHYAKAFSEAAQWFDIEVEVTQKPPSKKGFIPQKGR